MDLLSTMNKYMSDLGYSAFLLNVPVRRFAVLLIKEYSLKGHSNIVCLSEDWNRELSISFVGLLLVGNVKS